MRKSFILILLFVIGGITHEATEDTALKWGVDYVNEKKLIGNITLEYVNNIVPLTGNFESIQIGKGRFTLAPIS